MMYNVFWTLTAELTFEKEVDFILKKWSVKEVNKFRVLVVSIITDLAAGVIVGKPSNVANVRIFVISKQTSLAYRIIEEDSRIELLTFWNNKIAPDNYSRIIDLN